MGLKFLIQFYLGGKLCTDCMLKIVKLQVKLVLHPNDGRTIIEWIEKPNVALVAHFQSCHWSASGAIVCFQVGAEKTNHNIFYQTF